jgi:hypothetical protein
LRRAILPAAIYALAVALRLIPTVFYPGFNHPDEIFQTLEPAHRLVFGYGLVPWEFVFGARSWLLPGALAGLMRLGDALGSAPENYLAFIHVVLALLAASTSVCAFLWGRRAFGVWGGILAASLPTLWPDAVYFGARTLSECVAAPLLVMALYLVDRDKIGMRRAIGAGLLLGLAAMLRLQLVPAIAAVVIWQALGRRRGAWLPLAGGAVIVVIAAGLLDAATWGYPFQSLWRNFIYNTFYGVSAYYGTEDWSFYPLVLLEYWRGYAVLLLALAALGARRLPLPLLAAALIFAAHMAVPHKELRFLYPAILLLLIVAGMGLAQLGSWAASRWRLDPLRCSIVLLTAAVLAAGFLAATPAYRELWQRGHDMMLADIAAGKLNGVCGIGAYRTHRSYTLIHRNVPLYWTEDDAEFARDLPGFNTLVAAEPAPPAPGFTTLRCYGKICMSQRPGSCADIPPTAMPRPAPLDDVQPR